MSVAKEFLEWLIGTSKPQEEQLLRKVGELSKQKNPDPEEVRKLKEAADRFTAAANEGIAAARELVEEEETSFFPKEHWDSLMDNASLFDKEGPCFDAFDEEWIMNYWALNTRDGPEGKSLFPNRRWIKANQEIQKEWEEKNGIKKNRKLWTDKTMDEMEREVALHYDYWDENSKFEMEKTFSPYGRWKP